MATNATSLVPRQIQQYQLEFVTPAFLGNASQQGQWRTPPLKAALRHWWRIIQANDLLAAGVQPRFLHRQLLNDKRALFGGVSEPAATGKNGRGGVQATRSLIQMTLSRWNSGTLKHGSWPDDDLVAHSEVEPNYEVGAQLYLGFGPITTRNHATAISDGDRVSMELVVPQDRAALMRSVLQLLHWFGCVGGRSRNAWGSLSVQADPEFPGLTAQGLRHYLRPLEQALELDWPHCIASRDDGLPAVWLSQKSFSTWRELMKFAAELKIDFRTRLPFGPNGCVGQRHILAYPVTHHAVPGWREGNKEFRWPNQLGFKALRGEGGLRLLVAHFPCGLPEKMRSVAGTLGAVAQQAEIWRRVYSHLDQKLKGLE